MVVEVTTANSVEEMLDALDENRKAADANVEPWQEKAAPGMYFFRVLPEYDLVVYGEIIDPIQSEIDSGADEDEVEYQKNLRSEPHMKHFRFTKSYSVACEDGEYGDIHVCTIFAFLTRNDFEKAKTLGWPCDPEVLKKELHPFREVP